MSRGRPTALLLTVLIGLALPAAGSAHHTRTTASISAEVTKLRSTDYWVVEILWNATCHGSPAEKAVFTGTIAMVDRETGELIELGAVADTSGRLNISGMRTWYASSRKRPWTLTPQLTIECHEDFPLEGGPASTAEGAPVTIPPIFGRGGGGGGQGGGSGGGGGDPTDALGAGGCRLAVIGTNGIDVLRGGDGGDVIVGFAAGDRLLGQPGHDCLIGGSGADQLEGGLGNDRLTAGSGRDMLRGEKGLDFFDAGSGGDHVIARDGQRERVRCGPGVDRAAVDKRDRVRGCEILSRG